MRSRAASHPETLHSTPVVPPPPPPPTPVAGEAYKGSETTRILSAAAYLDRAFREQVLKNTLDNRHQAFGACVGLDMATVVRHCRRAKSILDRRALWLLLPGVVGLVLVGVGLLNQDISSQSIIVLLLVYLIAFAICFYFDSRANSIVRHNFLRRSYHPDAPLAGDTATVDCLEAAETGNTVIYSGFNPFVGSGENMGAWSFALDLRKRAEDPTHKAAPQPDLSVSDIQELTLEALYARVARDIADLHLDRVTVQDKLYISGRDIRDDTRFLSSPLAQPNCRVDERTMRNAMLEQGEEQLRHYRCIRVVDWSGELVLSIFLRFSKLSHNLFVEASYFLLTPIADRYRTVDTMSPHLEFSGILQTGLLAAFKTPFVTLFAPFGLLARVLNSYTRWTQRRKEDQMILENPAFDYGAAFSFRQAASANAYRRYFQRLDKEMYVKVLEKNILDSILTFLEENDVDVSELKQRQTMILNQGVILSGGSMTAENVSVGLGAKIENVAQQVANMGSKKAAPAAG